MEQYPITKMLEAELEPYMGIEVVKQIVEVVGEYEHGTADLDTFVSGVDLKQYAEVALDLALAIGNMTLGPANEV